MVKRRNHSHETATGLSRRNKLIAATAAPLAAITLLSACGKADISEAVHEEMVDIEGRDTNTTNSNDSVIENTYRSMTQAERDGLPVGQYEQVPESLRAADRVGRFYEHLPGAFEKMKDPQYQNGGFTPEEAQVMYMPDLNKPRSEWSDQDYLNYYSVAVWLITTQSDRDEALKALTVVARPDTKGYEFIENWIKDKPGVGMKVVNKAIDSPLSDVELQAVTVGGVEIDNDGGRAVNFENVGDGTTNVLLFANRGDGSGRKISIVEYTYDSMSDAEMQRLINIYSSSAN